MEKYNYREEMVNDILTYFTDNNINALKLEESDIEELQEKLWIDDSVTGNGSGSYFFNTWKAEEALCHNWDLLEEAMTEFGKWTNFENFEPETLDVTIRCYLLAECLNDAIERKRTEMMALEQELIATLHTILTSDGTSVDINDNFNMVTITTEGLVSLYDLNTINNAIVKTTPWLKAVSIIEPHDDGTIAIY